MFPPTRPPRIPPAFDDDDIVVPDGFAQAPETFGDPSESMLEDGAPPEDISMENPPDEMEGATPTEEAPEPEEEAPLVDEIESKFFQMLVENQCKAEEFVRNEWLKKWRKAMYYWDGYQYLAWDDAVSDYRTPDQVAVLLQSEQEDFDPAMYAKVVNIYKAHGQILIGALSSGIPSVKFAPSDVDDQEDVTAAKAHTKIAEIIQKHNKARLLLMRSLFILYNQSFVAAYNENRQDEKFGKILVPDYQDVAVNTRDHSCPSCGFELGSEEFQPDPMQPGGPQMSPQQCPQCGETVQPDFADSQSTQTRQVGEKYEAKQRECIEVYGPLNVRIPAWCRKQEQIPILVLETEEDVALLREIYPEFREEITAGPGNDTYERESRVPTSYRNDWPRNQATVQRAWIRPWAMNQWEGVAPPDELDAIKAKYPDGAYVVIINGLLTVEILPDKMDDHWTISENPLSETITCESIGSTAMPMQDIENELTNLTLETIEFGIPEIFADPSSLGMQEYSSREARPGQITPAKAKAGQNLSGSFHEIKPASLSREVDLFANKIDSRTQFVMGSYPSIYGGSLDGGSGTAKEYEMSKASALQRLSLTWLILQEWWVRVIAKATRSFAVNLRHDDRYTLSKGNSFFSVWVKRAELSGEVADTDPEISETFPVSWTQKRDVIMHLLQLGNEAINQALGHPENAGMVANFIGVSELFVPGEDDRNKQLYEISQLIRQQPMPNPAIQQMMQQGPSSMPASGPPPAEFVSSIQIEPVLDNHQAEAETCKAWLKSEVGMDAKETNPPGYMNVLLHMKEHDAMAQQLMAPPPDEKGSDKEGEMTDA